MNLFGYYCPCNELKMLAEYFSILFYVEYDDGRWHQFWLVQTGDSFKSMLHKVRVGRSTRTLPSVEAV